MLLGWMPPELAKMGLLSIFFRLVTQEVSSGAQNDDGGENKDAHHHDKAR